MRKSGLVSFIAVFIVVFIAAYFYFTSDNQKDKKVWEQLRSQLTEENIKEITVNKTSEIIIQKDEFSEVLSLTRKSKFDKSNRVGYGPTPEATITIVLFDGMMVNASFWGGNTFEFSPMDIDVESQFLVTNDNLGDWIKSKIAEN